MKQHSASPCCVFTFLLFPLAVLPLSCEHQRRQRLNALPFDLAGVSCVRGQTAAVSHTQYLTQSPELWTHPPFEVLLPFHAYLPSLHGKLSAFSKGQLYLYQSEDFTPEPQQYKRCLMTGLLCITDGYLKNNEFKS